MVVGRTAVGGGGQPLPPLGGKMPSWRAKDPAEIQAFPRQGCRKRRREPSAWDRPRCASGRVRLRCRQSGRRRLRGRRSMRRCLRGRLMPIHDVGRGATTAAL